MENERRALTIIRIARGDRAVPACQIPPVSALSKTIGSFKTAEVLTSRRVAMGRSEDGAWGGDGQEEVRRETDQPVGEDDEFLVLVDGRVRERALGSWFS